MKINEWITNRPPTIRKMNGFSVSATPFGIRIVEGGVDNKDILIDIDKAGILKAWLNEHLEDTK